MQRRTLTLALGLLTIPALGAGSAHAVPNQLDRVAAEMDGMSPIVPRSMRLPISVEQATSADRMIFAPGGEPLAIYMNRWGGTYTAGPNDSTRNVSSIVPGGSATVGGYPGSDAQWDDVMACVSDLFSRFNVYVTDIEPTTGPYVESVVGGSPDQLGLPWGVGGVAPFDPYGCEVIPNAIVYTFADVYGTGPGSTRAVCETAAQEIAHAWTLDHQMLCQDPMTYLDGCGNKEFQDEYAACGEWEARECSCDRPSQNSVQLMYELIGPASGEAPPETPDDLEVPTVSLVSPADGDILLQDTVIEVKASASDDLGLVQVNLEWDFSNASLACPGEGGGWECTEQGGVYTWRIGVSQGERTFRVRVRDVAGKEAVTEDRTIYLNTNTDELPPEDLGPPELTIVTPQNGAEILENDTVTVVATAVDDIGISAIQLNWFWSQRAFPCPMQNQYVSCEVEGDTYIWELRVSEGSRTFSLSAQDYAGNEVTTEERTVTLAPNVGELQNDDFELNDTWDLSRPVGCGTGLDLVAADGDLDWFDIEAAPGSRVRVSVSGEVADDLDVIVATGPRQSEVLADADGSPAVVFDAPDGDVKVRVAPGGGASGAYRLTVTCLPPDFEPFIPPDVAPQSCSHTRAKDAAPPLALGLALFGLALLGRRRRRN